MPALQYDFTTQQIAWRVLKEQKRIVKPSSLCTAMPVLQL
jgi:hypothetical protein